MSWIFTQARRQIVAFNTDALNQAVAAVFCDKPATWISASGSIPVNAALAVAPAYNESGFRVAGESITADCLMGEIATMKRTDLLVIETVTYRVLAVQPDSTGWATIILEKQ